MNKHLCSRVRFVYSESRLLQHSFQRVVPPSGSVCCSLFTTGRQQFDCAHSFHSHSLTLCFVCAANVQLFAVFKHTHKHTIFEKPFLGHTPHPHPLGTLKASASARRTLHSDVRCHFRTQIYLVNAREFTFTVCFRRERTTRNSLGELML